MTPLSILLHSSLLESPSQYGLSHFNLLNTIKVLLKKGANVDIQDAAGRSSIHHAVRQSTDVLNLILKRTKNINIRDREGQTPLRALLENGGRKESIRERLFSLLEAGASVEARNSRGMSPLETYKSTTTHSDDTLSILERFGCNINEFEESDMITYLITLVIDGAMQDGERIQAAFD
jgi:ankyrin repeat protein